jgi:hypothetical protein
METIKYIRWRLLSLVSDQGANQNGISLFDVKALYDAAYEEKARARACLRTFRALLAKAEALDAAYRAQLAAARISLYSKAV